MRYFATAPKDTGDLLAAELLGLGASDVQDSRGGVQFEGSLETAYRACLWSRLASRILMPLASFPAESPEALYAAIRRIDWAAHLRACGSFAVDTNLVTSTMTHSHYVSLKTKDAIVDQFSQRAGERPSVDTVSPDVRINCYIRRDLATIYLDLSGASLHQRNYRLAAGKAPMKENLAAAILQRAGWRAVAEAGGAFVDPMCGSGTLAIEAAFMAADIAPGLIRDYFGFLGWLQHDKALWTMLIDEATGRRNAGLERLVPIFGFDKDRRVLSVARENASRAGLSGKIDFKYQDVRHFRHSFRAFGLMATNPPYGRRMADSGELADIYRGIGRALKDHMRGWQAALFTEDQSLGKHLGMRADKIHSLHNGAIACKLIHFTVDEKNDFADKHLPHFVDTGNLSPQAAMFRNRLVKNRRQRKRLAMRENVSCYRVYDADLPDFAAAIDMYESTSANGECWLCVQEYEAPASIDPEKARLRTRELVTVTAEVFGIDDAHLFYRTRSRQRGLRQYDRMDDKGRFHSVREGDCTLLVNFEDYLDTGLFLDHRPMRLRLGLEASGKSFLNLFAYTGAATVHAAVGGASATTSVDISRTYLDWAERNLTRNDQDKTRHKLIKADCVKWLAEQHDQYDLIFLDPPTFSNSKRMNGALDVQRDQGALVRAAVRLLTPGGVLYFSTNARHFKLDEGLAHDFTIQDISAATIAFDFRSRANVHRCFRIQSE